MPPRGKIASVIPNARRAGYESAGLLARLMHGERVSADVRFIEPIGVAARQSTDVVALADAKVSAAVRFVREHASANITVHEILRAVPMSRSPTGKRARRSGVGRPHADGERGRPPPGRRGGWRTSAHKL